MRGAALAVVAVLAGSAAASHPVYDLVANRPLAHVLRAHGLFIPMGSAGAAKYMHFARPKLGWELEAKDDGQAVARIKGKGSLLLPLTEAEAASGALVVRVRVAKAGKLKVTARGKTATADLAAGWSTAVLTLPGGLGAGENAIDLDFGGAASLAWVRVGGDALADEPVPLYKDGLVLPTVGGLAYYLDVPAGASLELDVQGGTCTAQVTSDAGAGKPVELGAHALVDLGAFAGKAVRLELLGGKGPCTVTKGALTVAGPAASPLPPKPPRNVIIWLTDNTRADKVRTFTPTARAETPVLDGLAKRGVMFRTAYVQGNESRVSHASLWTALYPVNHGMIPEKAVLPSSLVTMAEAIPPGIQRIGISANGYIAKKWGFGEGWDYFKNHIHEGGGLKAEDMVASALKALKTRMDKPWFMFLGTIDAHVSWKAHEPWISKYDPGYKGAYKKGLMDPELDRIAAGKVHLSDRDKQHVVALYDGDISYNDQQLGVFMDALAKAGHADDTMLIVTADHGEEFWEHGRIGHGQSVHEELVHVPLLIVYPPLFPAGTVVDEPVEMFDIMPTVVDALGGKAPPSWQAASLMALSQGVGRGYTTTAVATQYENAHAMRLGRWKMRVGADGDPALWDIVADPMERSEVAGQAVARRLVTDALSLYMVYRRTWKKPTWGVPSNLLPGFLAAHP